MEKVGDEVLPQAVDEKARVPVAQRFHQLGPQSYLATFTSMMSGVTLPAAKPLIVSDLGINTGCSLQGFLEFADGYQGDIYYWGLAEDNMELEYVYDNAVDFLSEKFRNDSPALTSEEKSGSETLPEKCSLIKCVWSDDKVDGSFLPRIYIPESESKTWLDSDMFGPQLRKMVEKLDEQFKVGDLLTPGVATPEKKICPFQH